MSTTLRFIRFSIIVLLSVLPARAAGPDQSLVPDEPPRCRLVQLFDAYVVDRRDRGTVELVAEGRGEDHLWTTTRVSLPGVRRESAAHRRVRSSRTEWTSCWRLVTRLASVGCLRRAVQGNDHPVPTALPDVRLAFTWRFDIPTQRFVLQRNPAAELPIPRPLIGSPSGRAFHIPLPLERTTTAVAKRAIRKVGGTLTDAPDAAVLLLPDSADFCHYDRRSQPRAVAPLLTGRRVLTERALEALAH